MYIAMNRFQVKIGSEQAFEKVWASRETYLNELPGFIEFHLLRGATESDHTLYSSHTVWADKGCFEAWTQSEQFRKSHARASDNSGPSLVLGHPKFEGFEVVLTERCTSAAA